MVVELKYELWSLQVRAQLYSRNLRKMEDFCYLHSDVVV